MINSILTIKWDLRSSKTQYDRLFKTNHPKAEAKLEAHDASFGDVKLRLGVLEDAPVHPKAKEQIKYAVATEAQSFIEGK